MFPFRTVELAFRRFRTRREPRALAFVFDRTAPDLLALARHLAPPGTEPEDLVQATFVTAIEAADSHRDGERVLPWLCGILGNHARVARRKGRRAVDPARLPHAVGDAAADAEAAELRGELLAGIERLPEVYRPVLRLVFAHGLQANEVARALERPAGTVRAQLTRGLELLRRTLPAGLAGSAAVAVSAGRGLAAVRGAVLARAGAGGTVTVSPLLVGGWLVLHHKIAAAGTAALFAVLGLFWWFEDSRPVAMPPGATERTAAVVAAPIEPAPPPTERDRVAEAAAAAAPAPGAAAAEPPANGGAVLVRVHDSEGSPLAGIGVALHPFADLQDFGRRLDHRATDARGEVRFEGLAHDDWAIDVDRKGLAGVVTAVPGRTVERDVRLEAGLRAEGRVVDRRGVPVPGARIVLHGSRASSIEVAATGTNGEFTVEHLTAGVELQARAERREPSRAQLVRGAAGATATLELVLGDAARTLRGVVRDPDGRPVADAVVAILPAEARAVVPQPLASGPQIRAHWLRSARDGSFACDEVGAGPHVVFARCLPFAPAWTETDATAGDAVADVTLRLGGTLAGRVTSDGEPVAGVTVLTWPLDEAPIGYLLNLFGMRHATSAADGTFRIEGLVPGAQQVRWMQIATLVREQTVTFAGGATEIRDVELGAAADLRIVVRGARLAADQRLVALVRPSPLRDGVPPSLVPIQSDGTGALQAARDGALDVILTLMPGGPSILQLAAVRGVPPSETEVVFELRPDELPQRAITGRLVDAQRAPLAGRTITAARTDAGELVVRLDATTGGDGAFRLGPLPRGDYTLLAGPMQAPAAIGRAVVTAERDEDVGELVLEAP